MTEPLRVSDNIFDGPPPDGYADWIAWLHAVQEDRVFRGVYVCRKDCAPAPRLDEPSA